MTNEPIAWLACATDASESSFVTLFKEQAEAAARDWGWSVVPLAPLAAPEREDHQPRTKEAANMGDVNERSDGSAGSAQHTPGPWFVVNEDGADFTAISTMPTIKDGDLDIEHEVLGSSEWLRVKPADLRLMAAAPELLAMLERVIPWINDGLLGGCESYDAAKALIDRLKSGR